MIFNLYQYDNGKQFSAGPFNSKMKADFVAGATELENRFREIPFRRVAIVRLRSYINPDGYRYERYGEVAQCVDNRNT